MYTILEGIGLVCVTVVGLHFCRIIYRITYNSIIGPFFKKNVDFTQYGRWAVITGATDGIGRAYAEALAKQGMDIILISRNMSKLEAVSEAIEKTYQVKTLIIQADFTNPSPSVYRHIEKQLIDLRPSPLVLVNNVGMSYPYPEYFLDLPDRDQRFMDIINCNILSVTNMSKMMIRFMFDNNKGVIINISSTAALIPSPMLTVYAASKAYIEKFSTDLQIEYEKFGIIIQCVMPGYVATKMSKIKRSTWMAPSPDRFVTKALLTTGIQKVTTGYFPHSLLVGSVQLINSISPTFTALLITRTMENIRGRALRHQEVTN